MNEKLLNEYLKLKSQYDEMLEEIEILKYLLKVLENEMPSVCGTVEKYFKGLE